LRTQFMRSELAYANSDSASEPRLATSEASSLALEGTREGRASLPVRGARKSLRQALRTREGSDLKSDLSADKS
jgi:hypothetical protein